MPEPLTSPPAIRDLCKRFADLLAIVVAAPLVAGYYVMGIFIGPERAWPFCSQSMSLLPGLFGVTIRRAIGKLVFASCERDCHIGFGTLFSHTTVRIGRSAYIGPYCSIGDVVIADDVLIGANVSIINGSEQHGFARLDVPIREQPGKWPTITVGCDSWIGDRSIVMADIGKHCVVGAGSVVTKSVPDFAVVAGNPAKLIRFRNEPAPRQSPQSSDLS